MGVNIIEIILIMCQAWHLALSKDIIAWRCVYVTIWWENQDTKLNIHSNVVIVKKKKVQQPSNLTMYWKDQQKISKMSLGALSG